MHPKYREELARMLTSLNNQYNDAMNQRKEMILQLFSPLPDNPRSLYRHQLKEEDLWITNSGSQSFRKSLKRKKVDCLLVSKPENRRYLCGYRGGDHGIGETSGLLLVPARGQVHLLTDFRFKLQAEQDVPWAETVIYPKGVLKLLGQLLPDLAVTSLAFESDYTLHSFADKMTATLAKKEHKDHADRRPGGNNAGNQR